MIIFNNQEYNSFKELREKCHLVSEREVCNVCNIWWETVRKICEQYKIEKYPVISNGLNCFVYDESIIDLLNKIRPKKPSKAPKGYITKRELIIYLHITPSILSDLEFWCWDFKKYKKSFSGLICYEFTPEAKDFYDRKIYKWRNPDRKHGTCWQR